MDLRALLDRLFPAGHDVRAHDSLLQGEGRCGEAVFTVIGSADHLEMGVEQALFMARAVLATIENLPARPILFLVDTQGQRLRRRDEMLGLSRCMAHLAQCVDLARQRGHPLVGLVYDQALSGGFLATGMMADVCAALPGAQIRVMGLSAMARITRIPEERLSALAASSPAFAPGAANYVLMGAVDELWDDDLAAHLVDVIATAPRDDRRAALGFDRGGRMLAAPIARQVVEATRSSERAAATD